MSESGYLVTLDPDLNSQIKSKAIYNVSNHV